MKKTVIISVLFFIALTVSASANNSGEHKDLKALNNIANQVLELGKQENYEQAKKVLNNFPTLFLKQTSENQLSMAQVKMIIHTYEKAEEAVTRVQMNLDERIHYLTQFRLAVDALSSEHQPLWKEADERVLTPLDRATQALLNQKRDDFHFYLNEFFTSYEMIRPSLVIALPRKEFERVQSYVTFLENERHSLYTNDSAEDTLQQIGKAFRALFEEAQEDSAFASLIDVIFIIGGAIVTTLIYVGWRKYKGQKDVEKEYQQKRSDYM